MSRWDDAFDKPGGTSEAARAPLRLVEPSQGTHPYAAAALRSEAEQVAGTPNGRRNDALNRAWYRMGRHIGAGTIDAATVKSALTEAGRACGLDEREIDLVLRDDATGAARQGASHPRIPDEQPAPPAVTVFDLDADTEADFWDSSEILAHLHTFARARIVSPWAVLGATLARVVTATPFDLGLPPIVGTRASLNLFVGLVGPSGSGKGAAEGVAAEALGVGYVTSHNVGSGEGIGHGYMRRVKGNLEWLDDVHAVLFSVPEIDAFAALGDRKGATLMPQLRSAWSGEQLGFGYADPTKRIIVPRHEYRLCLVAGIQPGRSRALLDDADGGTPQRFLWLPATDGDIPDTEPDCPKPRHWSPPPLGGLSSIGGRNMSVCERARDTILEARRARARGDGDALDGHALLTRLKTAAALALLERRTGVDDTDWEMSGAIMRKSDATRERCRQALVAQTRATNEARALGEADRALIVAERTADAAVRRVCGVVARKLRRGADWTSRSDLRRAVAGPDRQHFETALERLIDAGQIEVDSTNRDSSGHGGHGEKYRQIGEGK